jgi:uncharacterized damage-inducible protein DinB
MDIIQDLNKRFEYNDWANRETLRSIRDSAPIPTRALKIAGHMIGSESLWLSRLRSGSASAVWPDLTLDQCTTQIVDLKESWQQYLKGLTINSLQEQIEYVNSKGEKWTNRVEEILTHVIMHAAYHRGQIATILREAGSQPAYTDYIHFIREGFVNKKVN